MSDETAREILERHVVRGRQCSCGRHWHDGYPEACSEEWRQLDPAEALMIGELRCGIVRDSAEFDAFVNSPPPYSANDPIRSPLDADDW